MRLGAFVYEDIMTLKPLAVRIPEDLQKQIAELVMSEKSDKATIVRNLLELGIAEERKNIALHLLRDEQVTFTKAAEIAKLSLWEFMDLIKQRKIEWVRYTVEDVESEMKEITP